MLDIRDKKISKIVQEIEKTAQDFQFSHGISDKLKPAIDRARKINDKNAEKKLLWEYQLFSFVTKTEYGKPQKNKRFYPMMSGTTKDGKLVEVPDINNFKKDSIEYFKKRVEDTKNLVLKARYSDFVWEFVKDPKFGEIAMDCYLELTEHYYKKTWFFRLRDAFNRAIYLVMLKVVNGNKLSIIKQKLFFYLKRMIKDNRHRFCLELIEAFTTINKTKVDEREYKDIINISRQCIKYFRNTQDFHLERSFLEQEEKLHSIYGNTDLSKKIKENRAQSYINQAEFFKEKNNFFTASVFYEDALALYRQLGNKEKINLYKTKLIEANRKSVKDFKKISTEIKISNKKIEEFTDIVLSARDLNEALVRLSLFDNLLPNYQHALKQAEEMKKKHPIQFLISHKTIDERGHLVGEGIDPFYSILVRNSMIGIGVGSIFLDKILNRLKKEKDLKETELISYFKSWGLISEDNLKILKKGIERYFSEDYMSSIHILIPQLEALIRFLLKKSGVQTISFERKTSGTQEFNLSELIKKPETRDILGDTLYWYIKLVLVEKLGYNLRNKIAHGLIKSKECNLSMVNIVLHIFVLLTRFKIDTK